MRLLAGQEELDMGLVVLCTMVQVAEQAALWVTVQAAEQEDLRAMVRVVEQAD